MQVTFIGVGEAFDPWVPNTSLLVRTANGKAILLDCGYNVPPLLWRLGLPPEEIGAVWISHFHADHTFGLPAFLVRLREDGRQGPLAIIGQEGTSQFVEECLKLAYPHALANLGYPLRFLEVEPGRMIEELGCTWRTALSGHSRRNLVLRLEDGSASLVYSGDGMPSPEVARLARGVDLLVHEAHSLREPVPGHASVAACLRLAVETGARRLALVHLGRHLRQHRMEELRRLLAAADVSEVLVPEAGDALSLPC